MTTKNETKNEQIEPSPPAVVYTMAVAYEVSILPVDWPGADSRHHWTIRVEWRGPYPGKDGDPDRWAVIKNGSQVLGKGGTWDLESRYAVDEIEGWAENHRFPLREALALAEREAPFVDVNGHSATEVLANPRPRG